MAMNATTLRNLIDTKFAALSTDYATSAARTGLKEGLLQAIAEAIVEHLQTDARATGTDSGGDTHTLDIE